MKFKINFSTRYQHDNWKKFVYKTQANIMELISKLNIRVENILKAEKCGAAWNEDFFHDSENLKQKYAHSMIKQIDYYVGRFI